MAPALDGFSRWGTLFKTYRAKSSLSAAAFAADDWKDVPQGLPNQLLQSTSNETALLWHVAALTRSVISAGTLLLLSRGGCSPWSQSVGT